MIDFNATILYLFDVKDGNPNGNPDEDNRPRELDDYGIVTSEALNSIIRKGWNNLGLQTRVQYGKSVGSVEAKKEKNEITKEYIDVRTFGTVVAEKGKNYNIRGCVHNNIAKTFHPVEIEEITLVATHPIDSDKRAKENNTFGKKSFIKYGLFSSFLSIRAENSENNLFTDEDFGLLIQGLKNGFFNNPSAARHMTLRKLIIFKQPKDSYIGDMNIIEPFIESVKLKDGVESPAKFSDYVVDFENIEIPNGVTKDEIEV